MPLLVLSQRMSRDSILMDAAAKAAGYEVIRLAGDNTSDWAGVQDLVAYCEGFMAEYVSQNSNMVLLRPLDCALSNAPECVVKRTIHYSQASELRTVNLPAFIKPSDQKFFKAGIYQDLETLEKYIADYPDDPIFMSEIVDFKDEYRHFCVEGTVLTSSPYILDGEFVGENDEVPATPDAVREFAQEAYSSCSQDLPPACVVDIGVLQTGECALIEFNPAWASGVYGCVPAQALECIARSCIDRSKLTEELSRYETFDCS